MRNEEIAYSKGYRVDKAGNLYHLNGRKYRVNKSRSGYRFYINTGDGKNITIYLGRLQAFQKYGKEFFKYDRINYLNGDKYDVSYENIALGKGAERLKRLNISANLRREQIAQKLGYSVSKEGILLFNGIVAHFWLNNNGYRIFSVTISENKTVLVLVHRLQALQKFGTELYKMPVVRHLDNNKLNNSYVNLQIGTQSENLSDMSIETKELKYFIIGFKKLKYNVFLRNRLRVEFLKNDMSTLNISRKYNIPHTTVRNIVQYKNQF